MNIKHGENNRVGKAALLTVLEQFHNSNLSSLERRKQFLLEQGTIFPNSKGYTQLCWLVIFILLSPAAVLICGVILFA